MKIVPATSYDKERREQGYAWVGFTGRRYLAIVGKREGKRRQFYSNAYRDAANMDADTWLAQPIGGRGNP